MSPTVTGHLEKDCRDAVEMLRAALIELYAAAECDPGAPQQVSRRFGLNKNLTWKVSKIVNAEDPLAAVQHMPGAAGLEILLSAFEGRGVPVEAIERVRACTEAFDRVVQVHAGDRDNLDLILDSMGLGDAERQLETSCELAFRGNSGIWGVQAKTRLTAGFVAPSRTGEGLVDTALVGGFVGFRRLRANVRWPLFRFQAYGGSSPLDSDFGEPGQDEGAFRPLRRFCSPLMPQIETVTRDDWVEYVLTGGVVGNTGAFDCFFGRGASGAPGYRTGSDAHGEFASTVTLPIEHLVFDVFVHRDVPMPERPTVLVYSRPAGGPDDPSQRRDEHLLPLRQQVTSLAGSPPAVATPLVPRYSELVQSVYSRMGRAADEFRGYRLLLRHPPMTSTVVLRWPLPERPGPGA